MKKIMIQFVLVALFSIGLCSYAQAAATINTSNAANGIVSVSFTGDMSKGVVLQVTKGNDKYQYFMTKANVNVPLQMGTGSYTVTVFEMVSGNQAKPVSSATVDVKSINEQAMYSTSVIMVEFASSVTAIPALKQVAGTGANNVKTNQVYENIVQNFSYDNDKAKNPPKNYVPAIDPIYASKKGICFDYSVVFGGALRSQGIPAKLVMGYAPDIAEYHAWNEIFLDGKWIVVDTTYDSAFAKAGQKYSMAKDAKKYKVVKVY